MKNPGHPFCIALFWVFYPWVSSFAYGPKIMGVQILMNSIRCIFFDLGKVLVDLDFGKFQERMLFLTGLELERLRVAFSADGPVLRYELGLIREDEFLAELSQKMGMSLELNDFLDAWTCIFNDKPIIPDAILRQLSGICPMWIISNTNRMHFSHIQERYPHVIECFRGRILSFEVGAAKPDPAIYEHALQKAGVSPSEALFIDDNWINVESALKIGMDAFQFLNFDHFIQEMNKRNLLI
jgi:putative hydrolase of the HAD superfamily